MISKNNTKHLSWVVKVTFPINFSKKKKTKKWAEKCNNIISIQKGRYDGKTWNLFGFTIEILSQWDWDKERDNLDYRQTQSNYTYELIW